MNLLFEIKGDFIFGQITVMKNISLACTSCEVVNRLFIWIALGLIEIAYVGLIEMAYSLVDIR